MKISKKIICSFLFVVFLITVTGISRAEDSNMSFVGHIGGNSYTVEVAGNYAYVGEGQDLVVLDITDTSNPIEVGKITTASLVSDIAISGNYAYVADTSTTADVSSLTIVDIANPSSPKEIGSYDLSDDFAISVTVSGNYAYLGCYYDLKIIDISNPSSPKLAGSYTFNSQPHCTASDVAVSGDYAYVAFGDYGLRIVDISNPSSPTLVSVFNTYAVHRVTVSGNYAYAVCRDKGIAILDISNLSSPTLVGNYNPTNGYAYSAAVSGNYVYVASADSGLTIVDITNTSSPKLVGKCDTDYATFVTLSGNHAYVVNSRTGLAIVDVADASSPKLSSSFDIINEARDVEVSGNYAYIADTYNGFSAIDITDPSSPKFAGKYYNSGVTYAVAVSGNYAYLASGDRNLVIVEISNPSSPKFASSCDTGFSSYSKDITIANNCAFIAYNDGIAIVDIANPLSPKLIGRYNVGDIDGVAVEGNYAYAAFRYGGFIILDITNPAVPDLVGKYSASGSADDIVVSGNHVYLANGGLSIVDVSDHSAPSLVVKLAVPAQGIDVLGNLAYVSTLFGGLYVVDITNAASPTIVAHYTTAGVEFNSCTKDDYVYVADGGNGLVILKTDISNQAPIKVGEGATTPEITQKFNDSYYRNGGLSVLGNPTTEVHSAFGFEVQDFPEMPATDGGVIMYNSNNSTAYFIHGAIWDKYYAYPDANKTRLGHIASDEGEAAIQPGKTTGKYTKFETGTIHWISDKDGDNLLHSQRGKSFVTYGDLDILYTEMGGTYSDLGFPVMDQVTKADGYDYCMFDGGIIVWNASTGTYKAIITIKPITIETSFLPNPNGYQFENYYLIDEYSWKDFESIYGDQDRYVHDYNLLTPIFLPTKANIFYNHWFKDLRKSGNCYGFSGSSLQLKSNSLIAYDPKNKEDKVPDAWSNVGPYFYEYSPTTVQDWIEYYTTVQMSKAPLDDISKYQEIKGEEITYTGAKSVYDELKLRMSSNDWAENPMILCFYCNVFNKTSGKIDKLSGHAVVPYKIVEDKNSIKIYVYDCNYPNSERFIEFDKLTWKASNYDDWDNDGIKEQPFDFVMVSLKALNAPPEVPDHVTANQVGFANLLFTDSSGKQLGYYQGEFKDGITGTHRIINYGSGTGSESLESYYVPDSSIKMELYGKNEGTSNISMLTPNGAITASVPVSANSVDEFKMLNDGKGVEFKSGSGTQSLNLTVSVETSDSAQIVYADFSQISTGRSIDLSNIDGTINIENDGQPITCSLHLAQLGINTSSNDSIENIVIEGESTIIVKPANWNDIANSEIVIEHDIGSDGSIESTETIRQKDTTSPSTVMYLQSTADSSWVNWTWQNPTDPDFDHIEIYLDGIFQTNTSAEFFNATGLEPETDSTIGTRTVDINGNVNETWVNLTATTRKAPIIVGVGSDQTGEEGTSVNFEGSVTASGSHTYSYHWDFGDGSAEDSSLTTSHAYADDGIYAVNLTVTDEEGDFGNDTLLVTVNNAIPIVDSGSDIVVTAGDSVSFSGTFSDPGWLDTHTAEWNFGEGIGEAGSVSEENEYPDSTGTVSGNFSYFDAGEYTVTLSVTDDDGGIGQDQLTVTVRPIEAGVTFDPETFNLNSNGEWVTAYIELPEGYSVSGIDISGVLLNGTVPAVSDPKYSFVTNESEYLTDLDLDGVSERMFKFNLREVAGILKAGDKVTVTFTGKVEYNNGISSGMASFEGSDVIRVTESKNKKG